MTKISDLTAMTGASVDTAADLLPIVDMSLAGAARNKKITIDEARIGLGLGTAASPQFTGINLGHASDTTISRASAGVIAVEGNNVMTVAGGTFTGDIIVPDEAYDATNWDGNLEAPTKNAVRDKIESMSGTFTAASTTEVLTGTDSAKGGTPDSIAALWEQGSDIASAATISVGEGGYFNITGTTTITDIDFGTDKAGRKVWVKFAGILTLTHHSTTLILPTGANITTAAGDTACFISEGSDNVRCVAYHRASGAALSAGPGSTAWALVGTGQTATGVWDFAVDGAKTNVDFVGLASYNELLIIIDAVTASGAAGRTVRVSTDNGSTFYSTSGDYVTLSAAGTVTNTGSVTFLSGGTSAASTMHTHLRNLKGAIKSYTSSGSVANGLFRASASDINAVRVTTTTADTMNGGKIYVYGR